MADTQSAGLIVEAGSPLVQFEVVRPNRGQIARGVKCRTPFVVWVNRNPEPLIDPNFTCDCQGPLFRVLPETLPFTVRASPHTCVCLCMGGFIE